MFLQSIIVSTEFGSLDFGAECYFENNLELTPI